LDEWSADQLEIMKIGGNGNAKAYFKKHGVSDAQMQVRRRLSLFHTARPNALTTVALLWVFSPAQSEKKYKTKAAQEYRRHLTKVQHEDHGPGALPPLSLTSLSPLWRSPLSLSSVSLSQVQHEDHAAGINNLNMSRDEKDAGTKWDSANGLDDMMDALGGGGGKAAAGAAAPVTVFAAPTVVAAAAATAGQRSPPTSPVAAQKPVYVAPSPAAPIGTLSVAAAAGADADDGFGDAFDAAVAAKKPIVAKKPVAGAKKSIIGAVRLGAAAADVRLESFEAVEKRVTKAQQDEEDRKIAAQDGGGGSAAGGASGSSRLAAIYQEAEAASNAPKDTLYRSAPAAPASTGGSIYQASSTSSSSSKYGTTTYTGSESNLARSKFASNKGISSDQFFGRDEEDMEVGGRCAHFVRPLPNPVIDTHPPCAHFLQVMKQRLSRLSTAGAISSDMLQSDEAVSEYRSSGRGGSGGGGMGSSSGGYGSSRAMGGGGGGGGGLAGIDKLKDSVSNFFEDIQRRIG
jgi:hypothetical protein